VYILTGYLSHITNLFVDLLFYPLSRCIVNNFYVFKTWLRDEDDNDLLITLRSSVQPLLLNLLSFILL